MKTLSAGDVMRLSSTASLTTYREQHQRECAPRLWDDRVALLRLGARRILELYHDAPLGVRFNALRTTNLPRLAKLQLTRRAVLDGILTPTGHAVGSNKVLTQGITKDLTQYRDGAAAPYPFAFVDIGTSTAATTEGMTGCQMHKDASPGVARVAITEKVLDAKTIRTSSYIESSEYVDTPSLVLAEACLCPSMTGTPYNRVLFTSTLTKVGTDAAICNIDHTKAN